MRELHQDFHPPSTGEWTTLLAAPTVPARELGRAELPDAPGVYLWQRDGRPVYVGMSASLRGRAWGKHLGGGVSLAGSSLRRNVCWLLFSIPPNITSGPARQKVTAEQAAAIRDWLLGCDLSWLEVPSVTAADELERRLRSEYLPDLNRV
ncbi:GIY-YIG nuclease family protein [Microbacterium memoriense]|uniref:GIY-YIG catalytic domain-containing protein n=1 Tax=Microbacterium memoriense TaxID=2978350 RepID=A0ABT2PCM8_9MICO|nr:hypothetical protein [Microbacterium memoriense]MCT9002345.1 hypothetical protein [Microbacterium memoriense]